MLHIIFVKASNIQYNQSRILNYILVLVLVLLFRKKLRAD